MKSYKSIRKNIFKGYNKSYKSYKSYKSTSDIHFLLAKSHENCFIYKIYYDLCKEPDKEIFTGNYRS